MKKYLLLTGVVFLTTAAVMATVLTGKNKTTNKAKTECCMKKSECSRKTNACY